MSAPADGTRGQTPDDVRNITPVRTFEAGETVPGLSSWVLERKLGGGGFGEVWLAKHTLRKEKPRAVKFCTDPAAKHRLVTHEKNVVARVMKYAGDHPNIVPLLEYNLDGDVPWLMYEFVEGGTLAKLIEQWRALPLGKRLGRAVRALHAISSALAACHRLDPPLVHRDMKPQNVLMAGDVPRITDFGIGGVAVQPDDSGTGALTAVAARLPSALRAAGTRRYAPPEQMLGAPPDPRDDVYALGIIAYQMVMADLTVAPGTDATDELRGLKVHDGLVSLIGSSVAMNPDRRSKSAGAWEAKLSELLRTVPAHTETRQSDAPAPTSHPKSNSEPEVLFEPSAVSLAPTDSLPLPTVPNTDTKPVPAASRKRRFRVVSPASILLFVPGLLLATVIFLAQGNQPDATNATAPDKRGDYTPVVPFSPDEVIKGRNIPISSGNTRDVQIAPGVKMTFCWVPKGECQLGSPKEEPGYDLLTEKEAKRGVFKTDGFWMGKYTVTQAEWKAVMRDDNPSYFKIGGGEAQILGKDQIIKDKITDTSRFPVEQVSWTMICGTDQLVGKGFLDRIDHSAIQRAFGKAGKFRLPHEDEWEYAARGGRGGPKGNELPFYWGKELNGTQANVDGKFPYGTTNKGAYLNRPCAVDGKESEAYPKHPWGLMHMHGNVWQWCENKHDGNSDARVLRGGTWADNAFYSRAAYRRPDFPNVASHHFGFRLRIDF